MLQHTDDISRNIMTTRLMTEANLVIFQHLDDGRKNLTLRIMAESSRADAMSLGGAEPQPNSDIHSRLPVGLTSCLSSLRMLPRYCNQSNDPLVAHPC